MGAVNSSQKKIRFVSEKSGLPITTYIVDNILDDEKMSSLSCNNSGSESLTIDPAVHASLSKQVEAFKQNTRAGRLESTPSKPITLARMVEDLACNVHQSPSLHTQSLEIKVAALKTLAAHLLSTRWNEDSNSTSSEMVPRALLPRLAVAAGVGVAAPRLSVANSTVSNLSNLNNNNPTFNSSASSSGTEVVNESKSESNDQVDILASLNARMEASCNSSSFEEAARHVMSVASLPLTMAFVTSLISLPAAVPLDTTTTTTTPPTAPSTSNLLQEVEQVMERFVPPPKKCAMIFGPFINDILLGSPLSVPIDPSGIDLENESKTETKKINTHSIIAWFVPRPLEEQSISFSLLNHKKQNQLQCEIVWSKSGMGSVNIHLKGSAIVHPVHSHLIDGTVEGRPLQLRLDVKGDVMSLFIDGVPLLPKDSRLSSHMGSLLQLFTPKSKVWLRTAAVPRIIEEEEEIIDVEKKKQKRQRRASYCYWNKQC